MGKLLDTLYQGSIITISGPVYKGTKCVVARSVEAKKISETRRDLRKLKRAKV